MNKTMKHIALILIIGILAYAVVKGNFSPKNQKDDILYSTFVQYIEDNKIEKVKIRQNNIIEGVYKKGGKDLEFKTVIPYHDPFILTKLIEKGVEVEGENPEQNMFLQSLISFLPYILIIGLLFIFMMRQLQSTGNKAMSFGKSKAKLNPESKNKITFADVAGIDEAKEELGEVVDFLKSPEKFSKIGARIPKGILLMGPPGTGKTLLARAIAGEAGVKFFSISGSDFVEMFVGVGASRVRDLFDQGKKNSPCIIFVDEIDAVGRLRGAGLGGGHDEREQTLNQLLVEMDGFEANEGVIIIAATNRPDVLDPALLRPGRFDRQVVVDRPDVRGREKILAVHTRKVPLAKEVDLKTIAKGTPGFTGADLENLVNEGALLAARADKQRVSMEELEDAKDKVLMGPERKSMLLTETAKIKTAYHESGHAIIGVKLLEDESVVHKVTIIPRGRALGVTMQLPHEDKHSYSKNYFLNNIAMLFGGYVAEKIKFGQNETGVGDDIRRATDMARRMVCEFGMSERFGPMVMGLRSDQPFIGRDMGHEKDYSEATAQAIDQEVEKILRDQEERARKILEENGDILEKMKEYLVTRETINAEEVRLIMNGEDLPPLEE